MGRVWHELHASGLPCLCRQHAQPWLACQKEQIADLPFDGTAWCPTIRLQSNCNWFLIAAAAPTEKSMKWTTRVVNNMP